jgi:Ni/Co efflux regulator RcnB
MKKIITVLIAVAAFASVHAQSSKDDARRVVLGQPKRTTTQQQGRNVILGRSPQESGRVYKTNRTVYYGKKSNPGKHLGWYKGVGNPHRYGMQPGRGKEREHEHGKGHGRGKHDD